MTATTAREKGAERLAALKRLKKAVEGPMIYRHTCGHEAHSWDEAQTHENNCYIQTMHDMR